MSKHIYQLTLRAAEPMRGEIGVQFEAANPGEATRVALALYSPVITEIRKLTAAEAEHANPGPNLPLCLTHACGQEQQR